MTARFYWPGEDADAGTGLSWVLCVLLTAALAVAATWICGATRVRWSWTDAAFLVLVALVGLSTEAAADRRPALNLAWEWGGLAILYLLLRNLPRTRAETNALTGALLATAVAVSAYGIYQVAVEYPALRAYYLAHPREVLIGQGIDPDSPSRTMFENRLLGSSEPMATFALANSLAGFLVGPTVLALAIFLSNALRRERPGSRLVPLVLAVPPLLMLLACLVLTKSRSAYLGLLVALAVMAWRERGGSPRGRSRWRLGAVVGLMALVVGIALAAGQLDREVVTESTKSLRYRWEYWEGTWKLLTGSSRTFWSGVGPGNFAGPYLRYKLPQSSEEIRDPHNMVLDVWATAGVFAALMLLVALGLALRDLLGRARPLSLTDRVEVEPPDRAVAPSSRPPDAPPTGSRWLWMWAAGGWVVVVALGHLNPFAEGLLARWLILGAAWVWGAVMLLPLWRRLPIAGSALGLGALAMMVNLLAAGGIGIPPVALGLWGFIALGQDLRDDRPCGACGGSAGVGGRSAWRRSSRR